MRPAGGTVDISGEPAPRLIERHVEPRPWTATWIDPPFHPEPPDVTQAYAICFVPGEKIVLIRVALDDGSPYWNLPGGGVKPGETLEDCLHREVMEEACARVRALAYLGCQRIDDPHHPAGPWRYYQARFWAALELRPWQPRHETLERRLVAPQEFLTTLAWGHAATAGVILEEGLRLNARFG